MSSRKDDLEDYGDEGITGDISNNFPPITSLTDVPKPEDMVDMSQRLLLQSYDFCQNFVPVQLEFIRDGISVANNRMTNARSADEYMKLAATVKTLYGSYSALLEQSTVVFMSSYRPLKALIESESILAGISTKNANVNNTESVTDLLDLSDIEDDYISYTD